MKSSNYLRRARRKNHSQNNDNSANKWQEKVIGKNHLMALLGINRAELDLWIKHGMPVLRNGGFGKEWEFDLISVKAWADSNHHHYSD